MTEPSPAALEDSKGSQDENPRRDTDGAKAVEINPPLQDPGPKRKGGGEHPKHKEF